MGYRLKSFGNAFSYDKEDYLNAALQIYEWVESNRIDDETGVTYRVNPGSVVEYEEHAVHGKYGLYSGSAGIGIFLLRLYEVTGDAEYLKEAKQVFAALEKNVPGIEFYSDKLATAMDSELKVVGWHTGIYTGPAGAGIFALELYRVDSNERYLKLAIRLGEDIVTSSKKLKAGLTLSGDTDVFSDGGYVLYFISLYNITGDEKYLDIARDYASYIYSTAKEYEKGGIFFYANDLFQVGMPKNSIYPGFAHGTSGIGYLFATLYAFDNQQWEFDAAKKVADFLINISDEYGEGRLVPYIFGGEDSDYYKEKYYLGFCHGPAGTSLLYRKLYDLTKDEKYLRFYKEFAQGIVEAGAPEYNSWGFWNSYCSCCGAPGLIEYYADLFEYTGEAEYLELAKRSAARTIGDSTSTGKGRAFYGSWDRTDPKNIQTYTGLYTGAAGAASNLLRLYAAEEDKKITPLWEYSYL